MRRNVFIVAVAFVILIYLFLFLGIELDLKNVIERWGVKTDQLIDTSFKIRRFTTLQLVLFLLTSLSSIYLLLKSKGK